MEAREDIPRVSVDSVQDWKNIRARYREAAMESLQAQFAANKSLGRERDAMIAHLDEFIDKTFSFSQPNLRVNGQNFESFDSSGREMEPFDEALDRRIWSLASTRLQWHKRIAEVRRTIPKETQASVSKLYKQHDAMDELQLPPHTVDLDDPQEEDVTQQEQLQDAIQKTAALVNELDQTITRQKERGERIRVVAKEVEILKS
ncbi:hypothetical protein CPB83DRAFT_847735 [Crepidotus variabilis]|uniref:Uncharacterized protein n=1 Tax=Crepidotus variabilis TaxID=179855 RepID=A0A9P6JUC2_9AGAR|nr:hypothetical protein CPB83DRAFT_847735 [Crepidotus variabilis]